MTSDYCDSLKLYYCVKPWTYYCVVLLDSQWQWRPVVQAHDASDSCEDCCDYCWQDYYSVLLIVIYCAIIIIVLVLLYWWPSYCWTVTLQPDDPLCPLCETWQPRVLCHAPDPDPVGPQLARQPDIVDLWPQTPASQCRPWWPCVWTLLWPVAQLPSQCAQTYYARTAQILGQFPANWPWPVAKPQLAQTTQPVKQLWTQTEPHAETETQILRLSGQTEDGLNGPMVLWQLDQTSWPRLWTDPARTADGPGDRPSRTADPAACDWQPSGRTSLSPSGPIVWASTADLVNYSNWPDPDRRTTLQYYLVGHCGPRHCRTAEETIVIDSRGHCVLFIGQPMTPDS